MWQDLIVDFSANYPMLRYAHIQCSPSLSVVLLVVGNTGKRFAVAGQALATLIETSVYWISTVATVHYARNEVLAEDMRPVLGP